MSPRVVYLADLHEEQAFAERAAKAFLDEPKMYSFTDGDIKPGVYLAIRWGLHDRAVLVLKLAEDHTPLIYGDLIPMVAAKGGAG